MPFTFKPDVASDQAQPQTAAPSAALGSSSMSLMSRGQEEGKSIVQLVLMVALGLSVFTAVALFAYSYYLSSQIDTKKAQLNSLEQQLGTLPLQEMQALSNRIKVINQLVSQHPSVNAALRIVEDSVENEITYTQFILRYNTTGKNYLLSLKGVAPTYKSIAQQLDTLKRDPYKTYLGDLTLQGLAPDNKGDVGFGIMLPVKIAGVLPEDLNLSQGAAALVASTTVETSATTTPDTETASSTAPQAGTSQ